MATVFWDSQGVIYIDYLEKGKTFISKIFLLRWAENQVEVLLLELRDQKTVFTPKPLRFGERNVHKNDYSSHPQTLNAFFSKPCFSRWCAGKKNLFDESS